MKVIKCILSLLIFSNISFGNPVETWHASVSIIKFDPNISQKNELFIGIKMDMQKNWHTYWKNPGDAGYPTHVSWKLPEGVIKSEISWPTPEKIYVGDLVNYGYKDKYLLTLVARRDGSSVFEEGRKYAFFPSAGAAWRISEEDFMQSLDMISNLKLRASYGIVGEQGVNPYNSYAKFTDLPVFLNDNLNNAVVLEHYGDILYKLNLKKEALTQWKKSLNLAEEKEGLQKKIKNAQLDE